MAAIDRYRLSNIVNMDQTPLPFEYLEGQTYNNIGEQTIWVQSKNFLQYIEEQPVPVLQNQPTLLTLNLFAAHKTEQVLDIFLANDITVSLIPGSCTSLVQPLDVSINCPIKDLLKEILEEKLDKIEVEEEDILLKGGRLAGSMIGRRGILTTWAVGEAWEVFSREQAEVVKKSFRILGLALPINGSCDNEISVKEIESAYLVEGLREWEKGGVAVIDLEEDAVESVEVEIDEDVFYEENF
ncbi:hypothetical protein L873DRAFT_1792241 [Choiromyces venosus 120613-1]|uniref:DDE-1 domain-containing protein n=1 Tax=Choiromyces venosus 120613-1 TaxID=1336337 RepID=A0A3N4JDX8_9PEZI|nr:hypothetical protein L873DRAFT_1792241 [Choiromyces venosus 120613-1]